LQATVTAFDAYGNVASGYGGTVHFTSSDARATVPADETFVPADNGTDTVCCVVLGTAGSQTVTVADTLGGISSSSATIQVTASISGTALVSVAPGSAAVLLVGAPSAATAGTSFNASVEARDSYGNRATGYVGTVTFSSGDAQATLPSPYTFTSSDAGYKNN